MGSKYGDPVRGGEQFPGLFGRAVFSSCGVRNRRLVGVARFCFHCGYLVFWLISGFSWIRTFLNLAKLKKSPPSRYLKPSLTGNSFPSCVPGSCHRDWLGGCPVAGDGASDLLLEESDIFLHDKHRHSLCPRISPRTDSQALATFLAVPDVACRLVTQGHCSTVGTRSETDSDSSTRVLFQFW